MKKIILSLSLVLLANNALFTQSCEPYSVPWTEDFQTDIHTELPECWSKLEYGNVMIENYSDWAGINLSGPGTAFLITPRLVSPPGGFMMELKAEHENFENNIVLKIGSMSEPDDTSTFKQLTEVLLTTGYETYTVYFDDEFSGHIALRADFEGMVVGDQIRIDELTIDNIHDCAAPWNLTADEITASSIRLGWTQPGNIYEWDVIYGEYGFDPEFDGTLFENLQEPSYLVDNLSYGTKYQFRVRAVCNGEKNLWSAPFSFTTGCEPYGIPLFEDFLEIPNNDLPACWNKIEDGMASVSTFYFCASLAVEDGSAYLITPELDRPLQQLRLHISDVLIEELPECHEPLGLSVGEITSTSAVLSWIHTKDVNNWEIAYGYPGTDDVPGFHPDNEGTLIGEITEKTFVVTGLEPGRHYQFFVRGNCNGTAGEWSGPYDFLTRCAPHDLPLIEGFEGSRDIPLCWTAVNANVVWHNYKYHPDRCLKLQHFSGKPSFLISPHISTGLKDVRINFHALRLDKMTGGGNSELILGTMSNPDDATTFTAFTSFFVKDEKESGFQEFVAWFDIYEGNDQFIAFKLGDETDPYWYSAQMLIDDIIIDVIPECPEPWNISAAGITRTSAVISWSQAGDAESWEVAYGHTGFNPGAAGSLIEDISEKTFEINGLDPGTSYQIYVRAHCNDKTSNWSIPYIFSTECIAFDVPFSELFDNPTFPLCWSHTPSKEMDFVRWEVLSDGTGNNYEITGSFWHGEGVSRLITPPIDLSPALSVNLQFNQYYVSYLEGEVILKIQTSQDRENWIDEDFRLEAGDNRIGPETVEITISNISENTYISWAIDQPGNSGTWWLDSVKVTYEPATPIVEWPSASPVIYGDKLSEAVLEGGRAWHSEYDVTGRFVFDDQDMILPAGENHQIALTFLPDKGYNQVEGSVNITVYRADPAVTWPEAGTIKEGESLSASNLTGGSASHQDELVPGNFMFQDPETIPLKGEYQADVIFVPDDKDNYNEVAGTVMVTVTGPTQSDMIPGGALSEIQVFPNPFTSGITLLNARKARRFKMTDVIGQVIIDVMLTGSETETISTTHLPAGVYILTIYGENRETRVIRMVGTR